jgi:hypothetical protein
VHVFRASSRITAVDISLSRLATESISMEWGSETDSPDFGVAAVDEVVRIGQGHRYGGVDHALHRDDPTTTLCGKSFDASTRFATGLRSQTVAGCVPSASTGTPRMSVCRRASRIGATLLRRWPHPGYTIERSLFDGRWPRSLRRLRRQVFQASFLDTSPAGARLGSWLFVASRGRRTLGYVWVVGAIGHAHRYESCGDHY